jgi:hypothetical protein
VGAVVLVGERAFLYSAVDWLRDITGAIMDSASISWTLISPGRITSLYVVSSSPLESSVGIGGRGFSCGDASEGGFEDGGDRSEGLRGTIGEVPVWLLPAWTAVLILAGRNGFWGIYINYIM